MGRGIIGRYFFKDGAGSSVTANGVYHWKTLNDFFLKAKIWTWMTHGFNRIYPIRSTKCHPARETEFPGLVDINRPPRSPDLPP